MRRGRYGDLARLSHPRSQVRRRAAEGDGAKRIAKMLFLSMYVTTQLTSIEFEADIVLRSN